MTVFVLATLVVGIGLNTAIFSVVNAVLIRPLPIHDPDRVVWLTSTINRTGAPLGTSYPDFLDWKNQSRCLDAISAMQTVSFTITGNGQAEHLKGMAVSASAFRVWGVSIALGRDFTEIEDQPGAERVVILSRSFWQRRFGGDPNIVGQNLALDDFSYRVIGVLQPTQVNTLQLPDVWVSILARRQEFDGCKSTYPNIKIHRNRFHLLLKRQSPKQTYGMQLKARFRIWIKICLSKTLNQ